MPKNIENSKITLKDQCTHKSWTVRVKGYEQVIELFRKIEDEKSLEWKKYVGLIKLFASDGNVGAQEKGLEATLAFIENSPIADKTVGEVMPILVNKCVGSTKAKIKELAIQICLIYVEIEKQDAVLEELLKGTKNSNPKVSAACVSATNQILREFGSNVIKTNSLVKQLPYLLEDRDKNVRKESKILYIEMFKWIGPNIKSQICNLKPVQHQELEAEFEKVKHEKPQVRRYLRSQQSKRVKLEEISTNEADPNSMMIKNVDPADRIRPVAILPKISKDFYKRLELKQWEERKEALDALEQLLTTAPKLADGNYNNLVRALKKVITKDTNVVLVGIGAKCMAMLAKGLEEKFQPYALKCLGPLLEKFKEKKQTVVMPLREAVDAVYDSMTLEIAKKDILSAMESKNPAVKAETAAFLGRCFAKCIPANLNKKLLKSLIDALIKSLNESDPIVRDNSAEAIGAAGKVVGEKTIMPFLSKVDSIKIAKIIVASGEVGISSVRPAYVKTTPEPSPLPLVRRRIKPLTVGTQRSESIMKRLTRVLSFTKSQTPTPEPSPLPLAKLTIKPLTIDSQRSESITKQLNRALTFIKSQTPSYDKKSIFWIQFPK